MVVSALKIINVHWFRTVTDAVSKPVRKKQFVLKVLTAFVKSVEKFCVAQDE